MGEGIFCFTETPSMYFMGQEGCVPDGMSILCVCRVEVS
jgi:hypothetical protein